MNSPLVLNPTMQKRFIFLAILCGCIVLAPKPVTAFAPQNPLQKLGFKQCNSAPCYLEIIPGTTSWKDAASILLNHNFKKNKFDTLYSKEESIQGGIYVDRLSYKPTVVNSVSLSDLGQYYKITLADIVAMYGYPCNVQSDFKGSFWFAYPTMLVHVLSDDRDYLTALVIYFEFGDPQLPINTSGISTCQTRQKDLEWLLWFTF